MCLGPGLTLWYDEAMEKGHEICYLESKEPLWSRFNFDSSQGIGEVQIGFSGCTGGWVGQREHDLKFF